MKTPKRRESAHPAVTAAKMTADAMMAVNPSLRRQQALDDIAARCGHDNWNRFSGFYSAHPRAEVPEDLILADVGCRNEDGQIAISCPPAQRLSFGHAKTSLSKHFEIVEGRYGPLDLRTGYAIGAGRTAPADARFRHTIAIMPRQVFERSLDEISEWLGLPVFYRIETAEDFGNFHRHLGDSIENYLERSSQKDSDLNGDFSKRDLAERISCEGKVQETGGLPGIVVMPWNAPDMRGLDIFMAQARSFGIHVILPVKPGNTKVEGISENAESVVYGNGERLFASHGYYDFYLAATFGYEQRSHFLSFSQLNWMKDNYRTYNLFSKTPVHLNYVIWNESGGVSVDFGVKRVGALLSAYEDHRRTKEKVIEQSLGRSLTDTGKVRIANLGVIEDGDEASVLAEVSNGDRRLADMSDIVLMGVTASSEKEARKKAVRMIGRPDARIVTIRIDTFPRGVSIDGYCEIVRPNGWRVGEKMSSRAKFAGKHLR